jgi:hypothetical protein
MRTKSLILCAAILLTTQIVTFAQKTEVSVQKGKVIAETATENVAIDAGRKVVLAPGAAPVVSVDNPLVEDALELYKLVEKEKERSDLKIDSTLILVGKAEKDEVVGAVYFETPYTGAKATNVMTIPYTSTLGDFRVYDLSGNLCRVEEKSLGNFAFSYSIHLSEPVQPGEHFKLIGVMSLSDMPLFPGGAPSMWKEGSLYYIRTANMMPNCLNYYRFILPTSAILVDTNREIVATDTVDGQLAVTMRNYTGPYSDGLCMVALMHPEEDGTTLADIPDKYHGLRNKQDKQNIEYFRQEMNKIRAGMKHTDQSTPLAALLTIFSSAVHKDTDLYAASMYTEPAPDKIQWYVENSKYFSDKLDFLSTPQWPQNPGNGYIHPVYLCRKGSKINEFTQPMVYHDGKWYVHDTKVRFAFESEVVTPSDITAAKADGYLCDWEVAGPYIEKGKKCSDLFDIPFGPELANVDVPWRPISIEPFEQHPAYVDLNEALYGFDHAVAYLRTQIVCDKEKPARLEIYTDDGIKAWFNGKMIHANNISREIPEEPDKVTVTLKEGTNQLMLKVTNVSWTWGAVVRVQPLAEP